MCPVQRSFQLLQILLNQPLVVVGIAQEEVPFCRLPFVIGQAHPARTIVLQSVEVGLIGRESIETVSSTFRLFPEGNHVRGTGTARQYTQ